VIFEDEHLLVVNKPAGWNTHAPSSYAGEGIYDWFRHRMPRWSRLAILHRLDKETSGVLVFGKSSLANRSLTAQFTERRVQKHYALLTDRPVAQTSWNVKTRLARSGSRYASVTHPAAGELAETRFDVISSERGRTLLRAEPLTGRTHQIRVHAAESGVPVLGDTLYGGSGFPRVCLHAAGITFQHPERGEPCTFQVPADFETQPRLALRSALIDVRQTDAFRVIHGAADGWPGWFVDRLGDYLLSQAEQDLTQQQWEELERLVVETGAKGVYHKLLSRHVRRTAPEQACPRRVLGDVAPERFTVLENGLRYETSFNEGYSVGLFLDQRDNRHRLLTGHVAAGNAWGPAQTGTRKLELLNTFAYTCGFSVCAAAAGARVTSLDLSRKYLDWGRRNFALNDLDAAGHDFIHGDALEWMKRLHRKGRRFGAVMLDPPTFSQSKQSGVFRAEKDYGKLVRAALLLLESGGVLFASSNAAHWAPEAFRETVRSVIHAEHRRVVREDYRPQPPDFPIHRDEPAYLKTAWFVIG